eukprot:3508601-Rhodomonas_salina.1
MRYCREHDIDEDLSKVVPLILSTSDMRVSSPHVGQDHRPQRRGVCSFPEVQEAIFKDIRDCCQIFVADAAVGGIRRQACVDTSTRRYCCSDRLDERPFCVAERQLRSRVSTLRLGNDGGPDLSPLVCGSGNLHRDQWAERDGARLHRRQRLPHAVLQTAQAFGSTLLAFCKCLHAAVIDEDGMVLCTANS